MTMEMRGEGEEADIAGARVYCPTRNHSTGVPQGIVRTFGRLLVAMILRVSVLKTVII
jgi:hypothetical protein